MKRHVDPAHRASRRVAFSFPRKPLVATFVGLALVAMVQAPSNGQETPSTASTPTASTPTTSARTTEVPVVSVPASPTTTLPPSTTTTTIDPIPPEEPVTVPTRPPTTTTTTTIPVTTTSTTPPTGPRSLDDPTLASVCVSSGSTALRYGKPCRLIAYYGTPLASTMGILGRLPRTEVVPSLRSVIKQWDRTDPETDHMCTFEIIALTAQRSPGPSGLYRARITPDALNQMIMLARANNCLTVLDLQVGWSNIPAELPYFCPWLEAPDVHLALDPEWDMPIGVTPGNRVGSTDAEEINYAIRMLTDIVRARNSGPKLLVVHRFRDFMIRRPKLVEPTKEVRLLVNMDGFGPPQTKLGTYASVLRGVDTKLTGFKLFTFNDRPMLRPDQVINLKPAPMFINYQ